jgi:inhibitor of KinA
MNWAPYGPNAWLLRFADSLGDETFARGRSIAASLEQHPPEGLLEFVPSFTSVLLEFKPGAIPDPTTQLEDLARRFTSAIRRPPAPRPIKEIPVVYDGPDLERVANMRGLTPAKVGELHSAVVYKVYVIGFSPGFPYLGDLDSRLHTPRLESPRQRVAAGSVAIGGEHTGIYSVESPGGWNIIGRTSVVLFAPERKNDREGDAAIFWLKAGDRVRLVPVKTLS